MQTALLHEGETVDELGGGLKIIQNPSLYRFTSDAVLLSRFARAKNGDTVADFCAGSGIVGLHFLALHPQCVRSLTLVELQEELSDMSARSAALSAVRSSSYPKTPRAATLKRSSSGMLLPVWWFGQADTCAPSVFCG